ncbi:MAG: DUF4405 domain-containing protein [Candidatus Krumholzibacteria bacterium]|nr:DUF4405 domain-containing protein [Candidatus Krumholzibacteria bacterium]
MSLRRIVSLTLFLAIAMMLTSSIILYIVPHGRVAYWASWKLWGLSKTQWGNLHTNAGLLMLIAASFHVYYNWRPVTGYMKNKARDFKLFTPNFNAALAVTAVVATLTLLEVPPMAWVQDLGESIKDDGTETYGEPPYGHAEESGLRTFLRNVGLDPEVAKANLATVGIEVNDPDVVIADLARDNNLSPQELFKIMKGPEVQEATGSKAIPTTMPRGTGKLTLEAFCHEYNRDVAEAVTILETAGVKADPGHSLKDIAVANGMEVLGLLDLLREGYGGDQ